MQAYLDTPTSPMPTIAVFNLHKITNLARECMPQHPKMASEMAKNKTGLELVQVGESLLGKIKEQLR